MHLRRRSVAHRSTITHARSTTRRARHGEIDSDDGGRWSTVSPIKKIINRITGQREAGSNERLLRAFGKLPVSREFLHLEAGQGQAKLFQDWIKAGHDNWVRRLETQKRGQIAPSCMFTTIPESRDRAVVACIWNSRDNASPPRTFPFSLFLVQSAAAHHNWLDRFLLCENDWDRLIQCYDELRTEDMTLQELQGRQVLPIDDLNRQADEVANAAGQIEFETWLRAILPAVRCDTPLAYLQFLQAMVDRWRRHNANGGAAVRLPLSRAYPYRVQVAAWLRWLAAHLDSTRTRLTGLIVPQNVPETQPAITVATRSMTEADFQLLTTNAAEYEEIEDATQPQIPAAGDDRGEPHFREFLKGGKSLWDWAHHQTNALSGNAAP